MVINRRYRGTHTARMLSIVLTRPPIRLICPLGGYLLTFDPFSLSKLHQSYLFDDVILCLLLLPRSDHLIALSYSGKGALTALNGTIIWELQTEQAIVTRAALNNDGSLLATCSEFGNFNGTIEVWRVALESGFQRVYRAVGNYSNCDFTPSNAIFMLRMSPIHIKNQSNLLKNQPIPVSRCTEDFPVEAEPSLQALNEDLETHEVRECTYYACHYTLNNERRAVAMEVVASLVCSQTCGEVFVGAFQGRVLVGMRMESLERLFMVQIAGGAVLQCLHFPTPTSLQFVPSSGLICTLDISGDLPALIDARKSPPPCLSVLNINRDWVNSDDCYVGWAEPGSVLLAFDDCNIYSALVVEGSVIEENRVGDLQLSACGIALSPLGDWVAVGDLSGQLQVYETQGDMQKVGTWTVDVFGEAISVRSLLWSKSADLLVIGTLSGFLFTLQNPRNPSSVLANALECSHGITVIREKLVEGIPMLAIGTVGGEVVLLSCQSSGELTRLKAFQAHKPQAGFDSASYFGSLKHFSEVWSLAWAPTGPVLATSSEDQTVAIWEIEGEELLAVLPKHRRAVTGVDWKVLSSGQERLISCSDDRSVRVYDPATWQLLFTFWTTVIREWHTLTYACIDEDRNQAVVVSQNGYLFLLDLERFEVKYGKKIHYGSAEGLDLAGRKAATCSSECSVCISTLD